jgi:hypothetical protein
MLLKKKNYASLPFNLIWLHSFRDIAIVGKEKYL